MNCLELFSGCGGLGYGFHKEGFNIVCASELEDKIARTYALNFPDTNVIVGDIRDPEIKNQIYQTFENPVSPISCDIIIGGPPCVAYSMAGKRNSRDPRGQLFNDYIDIVDRLQPTIFVMENVKGILSMKHDDPNLTPEDQSIADNFYELENAKLKLQKLCKKAKSDNDVDKFREYSVQIKDIQKQMKSIETTTNSFKVYVTDIIKQRFHELGYTVTMQLMNAADYGVPQKRERVIFVGMKSSTMSYPFRYPFPTHNEYGTDGLKKWVSVRDAIDELQYQPENQHLHHIYTKHTPEFTEKIHRTKIGESVYPKYKESFLRCCPDKPSNTVKENHGGVFVHYNQPRVMTPRELARLQSFPDDFIFQGSKSNVLVQIGNAVPCQLSTVIARQIKFISH